MPRYRKKPVIIEAEQYLPGNVSPSGVRFRRKRRSDGLHTDEEEAYIETLEGLMIVSPGDYVITGIRGERYPCKPDIFEATYELVD